MAGLQHIKAQSRQILKAAFNKITQLDKLYLNKNKRNYKKLKRIGLGVGPML